MLYPCLFLRFFLWWHGGGFLRLGGGERRLGDGGLGGIGGEGGLGGEGLVQ